MSAKDSVQRGSEKEEDGSLILQSILDQILCNFSTTQVAFHWLRNTNPLSPRGVVFKEARVPQKKKI